MKTSVENKVVLGFVISILALLGMGWLSYRTAVSLVSTQSQFTHSYKAIATLEAGRSILTDAETAQRGYLLTGDETFLKDCTDAEGQVSGWLDKLKKYTADEPEQQQRVVLLEPLVKQRLALLNDRIQLRQQKGLQAVTGAVATHEGKKLMDQIQQAISDMHVAENKTAFQYQAAVQTRAHVAETIILGVTALAALVALAAVVFIRRDLKKRRMAEEILQQNEERLRLMIDSIKDYAVFMLDPDGRILTWNAGAQNIKGYTSEEIVGQHFSKFYPEELIKQGFAKKILAEAAEKNRSECEGWRVRKNGSRFWANIIITAVRDFRGRLLGFVKVTRDLSERKRAEQVQDERDRFYELSRDLICAADFNGYFKMVNPAWERTLGFSADELLSKPFLEFVHPDDRAATEAETRKLSDGGETINFENRYRGKDGSYYWLAWNARADIPNKLIYATARDITEQKSIRENVDRLNAELQRHASQLESANKELESFSYSVSHDLRAPLRHIDGFVKLLDKQVNGNLDERSRRYLDIIADSARRMGALIDDLLVFSRMGRTEMRRNKLESRELVDEVIASLQSEIGSRNIHWKIGALPEVEADTAMLRQVWINLIGNAIKYTRPRDPAEIEIGSRLESEESVFFVKDNGVGFDMQYAHKLFGVFQRLHRAEEFEGTGIGLANVQRIILRHGGRVWADGKPDEGATFYFSLPQTETVIAI